MAGLYLAVTVLPAILRSDSRLACGNAELRKSDHDRKPEEEGRETGPPLHAE
jgi:hypothetical protein